MRKCVLIVLMMALALTALLAGPAAAAGPQFKWKAQCLWSPAETTYKAFDDFCKRIKVMTNGRLEVTPFPSASIVPNSECLDAVKNNVMQAMHQAPAYFSGKNPALAALSDLTIAWDHPWQVDAFYHYGGGLDLLREFYKPYGVYVIGVMWWGEESWPSKKPIRRLEDFKGLKFRVPAGMEADLLTRLGASVVVLPGTEIYSALDKGVVDATNWSTVSDNEKLGFHRVAPYFTYPGFHSMPTGDFAVNMKEWNKLPNDIKAMLQAACRDWCWDVIERLSLEDAKVVAEADKRGIHPITWTPEEKARIRVEARKVWQDWKKKSKDTKRVIDAVEDFQRRLGMMK